MIRKWPVRCGHCENLIGFMLSAQPIPSIYCGACEDVVTHKEEMHEAEMDRYRAVVALQESKRHD